MGKNRGYEHNSNNLKFYGYHSGDVASEKSRHIIWQIGLGNNLSKESSASIFSVLPFRWRQYFPPNCLYPSAKLQSFVFQDIEISEIKEVHSKYSLEFWVHRMAAPVLEAYIICGPGRVLTAVGWAWGVCTNRMGGILRICVGRMWAWLNCSRTCPLSSLSHTWAEPY